jgi:hypothetical protein
MTQVRDDTTTRVLHMLALKGGKILHALATDWGPVTQVGRPPFNRFRSVSGWDDVLQVLGGNFGEISSVAIVGQAFGSGVHVFFVAKANNRYKLWDTGRFPSGAWRQPVDVFAASGEWQTGTVYPFKVAAGECPTFGANTWNERNNEILIAIHGLSDGGVYTLTYVSPARVWVPGRNPSNYSNLLRIRNGEWDPSSFVINGVYVTARPFSEMATP